MHPPDGPLDRLHSPEQRPVSAHAAPRGQKRMAFRLLSSRGKFAEMGDGGVEGINSVYYKLGALSANESRQDDRSQPC
jgi:hypothetical protein